LSTPSTTLADGDALGVPKATLRLRRRIVGVEKSRELLELASEVRSTLVIVLAAGAETALMDEYWYAIRHATQGPAISNAPQAANLHTLSKRYLMHGPEQVSNFLPVLRPISPLDIATALTIHFCADQLTTRF
jgi:hypothetical protein